ncbi:MSCRAMM family protein, partial [Turicibacter sanguinis]|uniref:MSCRAMM family protein n=3 Tax=Turicibacter sanguinis TaxID=154288 RepID=UPI00232EF0A5
VTGEVVHEWRTTDETKVIEGLPHGDYILREITAPDGFQKILDIEFTITDEHKVHVFEVVDELTLTTIHKVDPYGNQLKGATLQVYKIENGEEIFITEFVTGKDSTDLRGLKPGQYVLREVKAPKGYLKAEDVHFTVTDAHEVAHVTMVDEIDRTVPTTGLNDLLPMIAGVGLVSVGTILYVKRKRHN